MILTLWTWMQQLQLQSKLPRQRLHLLLWTLQLQSTHHAHIQTKKCVSKEAELPSSVALEGAHNCCAVSCCVYFALCICKPTTRPVFSQKLLPNTSDEGTN